MQDPRLHTLYPARKPDPQYSKSLLPSYALIPVQPYYRAPETFFEPDRIYLRAPGNKNYVNAYYQTITILGDQ